jgi:5-formyltetrahydrofolate cyclo-ligase
VLSCEAFARAERVVIYAAAADEAPTDRIAEAALASGKRLHWPRVSVRGEMEVAQARSHELVRDAAGMLAPPPEARAEVVAPSDIALVPGVAFTRAGARLGRGGGHYDRWLAATPVISIGIAFDIQLVDELPLEPHDRSVDFVATPSGLWRSAP